MTRRSSALLAAIDQVEVISRTAGADRDNRHDDIGLFGAGTPFAAQVGIEVRKGRVIARH